MSTSGLVGRAERTDVRIDRARGKLKKISEATLLVTEQASSAKNKIDLSLHLLYSFVVNLSIFSAYHSQKRQQTEDFTMQCNLFSVHVTILVKVGFVLCYLLQTNQIMKRTF